MRMAFLRLVLQRPVGVVLLALAVSVLGVFSYVRTPIAPLPQMNLPLIVVDALLPGASPEVVASTVALPLAQALGSIPGVIKTTASSRDGGTRVNVEFELSKDIDQAAQEVQGAIQAVRPQLPSSMRDAPRYFKINPSAMSIYALALTSPHLPLEQLFLLANEQLLPRLSQVKGVGEVMVGGGALPAIRIDVDPQRLAAQGIGVDLLRQRLFEASVYQPLGQMHNAQQSWVLSSNGQLNSVASVGDLILRWRDGLPLRLRDVANIYPDMENHNDRGFFNHQEGVNVLVRAETNANIIQTVDALNALLPSLQALLPVDAQLQVVQDRSPSIRATLHEAEFTLMVAIVLVIVVMWLFLRDWRMTIIPTLSVPISLLGTVVAIYALDFSLNAMSLMALIVATGFVVDDAIVVLENIRRHQEKGTPQAVLVGTYEVVPTIISMTLTLVAVFVPWLLMESLAGHLFREFAVTLCVAVLISLVLSLTLIPSLAHRWMPKGITTGKQSRETVADSAKAPDTILPWYLRAYGYSLRWALRFPWVSLAVFFCTLIATVAMMFVIPKGLFPQQDTGVLFGFLQVERGSTFQSVMPKLDYYRDIVLKHPSVDTVVGFSSGQGGRNSSFLLIQLKPFGQRQQDAETVVRELRQQMAPVAGARLSLVAQQDIFVGGRDSQTAYSLSLRANDTDTLRQWRPIIETALRALPQLRDVGRQTLEGGQRLQLQIDRDKLTQYGLPLPTLASSLAHWFGQSRVGSFYEDGQQYALMMRVDPVLAKDPQFLHTLNIVTPSGQVIALSDIAQLKPASAALVVNHDGLQIAESIGYNIVDGVGIAEAQQAIAQALAQLTIPEQILQIDADGAAKQFSSSQQEQPLLFLGALLLMYLVLGILYESFVLPLTVLSTLPSAALGALLALHGAKMEFSLIALIALFLLIGLVKKNAIMVIDFAQQGRREGMTPEVAIYQACLQRFRPIVMTTLSAIGGAVPLIVATGAGVEMRQPLGVAIVGGLLLSQLLTLYSTPIIYLFIDAWRRPWRRQSSPR